MHCRISPKLDMFYKSLGLKTYPCRYWVMVIAPPTGNSIWLCTATHPHRSAFKGCPTGSQQVIYSNARHTRRKYPQTVTCSVRLSWSARRQRVPPTSARGEGPLIAACSFNYYYFSAGRSRFLRPLGCTKTHEKWNMHQTWWEIQSSVLIRLECRQRAP